MIIEVLFLTILAVLLSLVVVRFGRVGPGPYAGFWFFFLLFLLAGWASSRWVIPAGPPVLAVYWAGPAAVTFLLALVLLAVIPASGSRSDRVRREAVRQAEETPGETRTRHAVEFGFSIFFWVAVVGLGLITLVGYLMAP